MAAAEQRNGKTTLIVLSAVFVVLAIAVAFVWTRGGTETAPDIDAGRVAADRFLEQIRKGNASDAWKSTTAEFKSAEGRESFLQSVKKHPELTKPVSFVSVQIVKVQNQPRAEYLYRVSKEGGAVRLLAGLENGKWSIDRLSLE